MRLDYARQWTCRPGSSGLHTHLQHGGLVGEAHALEVTVGVEAARHGAGVEGAEELFPVPAVHQVVAHIPVGRPRQLTRMGSREVGDIYFPFPLMSWCVLGAGGNTEVVLITATRKSRVGGRLSVSLTVDGTPAVPGHFTRDLQKFESYGQYTYRK